MFSILIIYTIKGFIAKWILMDFKVLKQRKPSVFD